MIAPAVDTRVGPTTASAWVGFIAMCIGMFMAILDIQIVATSLPAIQSALGIEPDQMSWIQTSYLIAEIIAIPLTGWLTRGLSLRGLFVLATSAFTLASLGCALSAGFADLIGARIIQGFAGGVLVPVVFSAVFLLFPGRGQQLATTIAGALAVLAPTIGPFGGGWVTSTYSWHWLFLINVFPGILTVVIALLLLPRTEACLSAFRTLDLPSLVFMAMALAALEIGLKEAPDAGWTSGTVLGLFSIVIICGILFARRALARERPLVDLRSFKDKNFALGCLMSFVLGFGLYGAVYLMPVFLGLIRGHDALTIGETMLVTGLAQLIAAPIAVSLEPRINARLMTAFGFTLFAMGLAMSAFDTPNTDNTEMIYPQAIRGFAIMFCLLPPTRMALGHLPPERVPDASGLFNVMRNLGGAIGLALIDTVIYGRAEMHGRALAARLLSGDAAAFKFVGLPLPESTAKISPFMMELARPAVEKAAFTMSIAEAWAMLAVLTTFGVVLTLAVRRR